MSVSRQNHNKPSFQERKPLRLIETVTPQSIQDRLVNATNHYIRSYRLGECSVLVTKEYGWWHLSISHPQRPPTWDEIAEARYRILPRDICAAMLLPPIDHYINLHPYCFHMVEIDHKDVPDEWKQ